MSYGEWADDEIAAMVRRRRRGKLTEDAPSESLTTEANNSPAFALLITDGTGATIVTDN